MMTASTHCRPTNARAIASVPDCPDHAISICSSTAIIDIFRWLELPVAYLGEIQRQDQNIVAQPSTLRELTGSERSTGIAQTAFDPTIAALLPKRRRPYIGRNPTSPYLW